jgi:hypothetical protein
MDEKTRFSVSSLNLISIAGGRRRPTIRHKSDNVRMKKRSIGDNQYLDYLWELVELPVYIIGDVGIPVSLRHDGLSVVKIRGSSKHFE